MKKLLLLFIVASISIEYNCAFGNCSYYCSSDNKTLISIHKKWQIPEKSDCAVFPIIYKSSHTIYIDTTSSIENLEVDILDMNNKVISTDIITVIGNFEYVYPVQFLSPGEYKIMLKYADNILLGEFTMGYEDELPGEE